MKFQYFNIIVSLITLLFCMINIILYTRVTITWSKQNPTEWTARRFRKFKEDILGKVSKAVLISLIYLADYSGNTYDNLISIGNTKLTAVYMILIAIITIASSFAIAMYVFEIQSLIEVGKRLNTRRT